MEDKNELASDKVYYLYFKAKPDRGQSPGFEEETKRVINKF